MGKNYLRYRLDCYLSDHFSDPNVFNFNYCIGALNFSFSVGLISFDEYNFLFRACSCMIECKSF